MKKNILFLAFLLASVVSFAQFPNYTNINGRYKWIAGKFDSTFTLPVGTTPSLRTGGGNAPGAMFYRTTDSTIYQYTGTQWIKLRGGVSPTDTAGIWLTNIYRKPGSDSVFYVKGGSSTFAFRDSVGNAGGGGGGGKIYYFNGGVSMGTIGGLTMYELGDTANTGAAANFTRATTGNLANFITDPGKPGLLQIPAGVWTIDAYLSETGGGANHAQIWIEVEKWDGSTITTIATSPIEEITNGSVIDLYNWSVSIPTTSLAITDRIVIQFYISNTNGKTVTLYTQNGYVGEVHTTFTTGIGSLNGLTAPSQFFATGTSGTDFNISSATATHTFNLPTASATNRGALSTTDWSTFNDKIGGSGTSTYFPKFTGSNTIGNTMMYESGSSITANSTFRILSSDSTISDSRLVIGGANYGDAQNSTISFVARTNGLNPSTFAQGELTYSRIANQTGKLEWKDRINGSLATRFSVANGKFNINNVPNATIDTDKFMVLDGDTVEYRTGSQVLSDIGGAAASSISGTTNYIPKFTSSSAIGNSIIYESGGNIGIGTISPTNARLEISADAGAGALSFRGRSSDNSSSQYFYSNDGATLYSYLSANASNFDIRAYASIPMIFYTANSERMRLDASGNLGLGTSSLSSKFHLYNGDATFEANTSNANLVLKGSATNESTIYFLTGSTFKWNIGTSSNDLTFYKFQGGAGEAMRLNASGNLGLGVTPSAWRSTDKVLQINNSSLFDENGINLWLGLNFYENTSGSYIYTNTGYATAYRQQTGQHNWFTAASGTAGNAISFTQAMTLDASGRLGIGTTNPARLLDVQAANIEQGVSVTSTTGTNAAFYGANNGAGAFYMGLDNSAGTSFGASYAGVLYRTGAYPITFHTNAAERMRITSGGNVGIGTTAPNSTLHVNGSVSTAISIKTGNYTLGASDYTVVFDISANTTATLPDATTCTGRIYTIKANVSNTSTLTIDGNGSQTIDGNTTLDLNCKGSVIIQSDGSNWRILSIYLDGTCL